jgi:hypothetical protein
MSGPQSVGATFAPTTSLEIDNTGNGGGTFALTPSEVCSTSPNSPQCTFTVLQGATLTVTPTPDSQSIFAGWDSRLCAGSGDCSFTVDGPIRLIAVYRLPILTLDVVGGGSVTVGGINPQLVCAGSANGNLCNPPVAKNTGLQFSASASSGFQFVGWSGACSGTGDCALTIQNDTTVNATFEATPTATPTATATPTVTPTATATPTSTLVIASPNLALGVGQTPATPTLAPSPLTTSTPTPAGAPTVGPTATQAAATPTSTPVPTLPPTSTPPPTATRPPAPTVAPPTQQPILTR